MAYETEISEQNGPENGQKCTFRDAQAENFIISMFFRVCQIFTGDLSNQHKKIRKHLTIKNSEKIDVKGRQL